jgi:hypothetical protein
VLYKSLNRADVEIDEIEDDKHVSGGPNEEWCTRTALLPPIWKGKSLKSIVALLFP